MSHYQLPEGYKKLPKNWEQAIGKAGYTLISMTRRGARFADRNQPNTPTGGWPEIELSIAEILNHIQETEMTNTKPKDWATTIQQANFVGMTIREEEGGYTLVSQTTGRIESSYHSNEDPEKNWQQLKTDLSTMVEKKNQGTMEPEPTQHPQESTTPTPTTNDETPTLIELQEALEGNAAAIGKKPAHYPIPSGIGRFINVHCELIKPCRWQPRQEFKEEQIRELADSIKSNGVKNRLRVFANEHGQLELIAGERRLRASRLAGLYMVPVEICEGRPEEMAIDATLDNIQRNDLQPLEEGVAFERLINEQNISEAALARQLGKSRGYIQQRRAIANATPNVQEALRNEDISLTQARIIAQGNPPDLQELLLKTITTRNPADGYASEVVTRNIAEQDTNIYYIKKVEEMGWKVLPIHPRIIHAHEHSGKPELWSIEKGKEITQEGAKPDNKAEVPKNGMVAEETRDLRLKYRNIEITRAWVICYTYNYNEEPKITSHEEAKEEARQIREIINEAQKKLGWGWSIKTGDLNIPTQITITQKGGGSYRTYDIEEFQKMIEKLLSEKPEPTPTPTPTPAPTPAPAQWIPPGVKEDTEAYERTKTELEIKYGGIIQEMPDELIDLILFYIIEAYDISEQENRRDLLMESMAQAAMIMTGS